MADVKPFFATIESAARPFGAALPIVETEPALSPWTPGGKAAPAAATAPIVAFDPEAVRSEAREAGRAEGLRETEALRARLTQLIAALAAAHEAIVPPATELIADAAAAIVDAWFTGASRKDLFAPIVRAWLARPADPTATARVHPDDVAAVTELVGEAKLAVAGDAELAPGDIRIRGAALELSCAWTERLADLRRAIAEVLA